jgi:ribosome modulation factor
MRALFVVLATLMLAGCDKIEGLIDKQAANDKAVGYSCRIAGKKPDECMQANPKASQSHILSGWQKADEDIKEGITDPEMKNEMPMEEEETEEDAE